jgi:hypothetical protein
MSNSEMLSEKYTSLRRQAEERINQWPNFTSYTHEDLHKVIHELKIHLAELEIQNEELKRVVQEMVMRHDNNENRYECDLLIA